MIEYMLNQVITNEFEKVVGKNQGETGKAMHIGFNLHPDYDKGEQYRVVHLYLYAPMNYVYVALHGERIDEAGDRIIEPMRVTCYHDSCWRDSIQDFLFKNRGKLSTMSSFDHLSDWYDVVTLSKDECDYLYLLNKKEQNHLNMPMAELPANPFDARGFWAKK